MIRNAITEVKETSTAKTHRDAKKL